MLAMQVFFISAPQEQFGYSGYGNSQHVAKHMDTDTTQTLFKLAC